MMVTVDESVVWAVWAEEEPPSAARDEGETGVDGGTKGGGTEGGGGSSGGSHGGLVGGGGDCGGGGEGGGACST